MNADLLRVEIRAQLRGAWARRLAGAEVAAATASQASVPHPAAGAVVIPLRLQSATDSQTLVALMKRLAASPGLMQMLQAGLLRFDLQVDPLAAAATADAAPAACCNSCESNRHGEAQKPCCGGGGAPTPPAKVPMLKGVVSERQVKALGPEVQRVRLHAGAVLTPLGKEMARKRGISIEKAVTT